MAAHQHATRDLTVERVVLVVVTGAVVNHVRRRPRAQFAEAQPVERRRETGIRPETPTHTHEASHARGRPVGHNHAVEARRTFLQRVAARQLLEGSHVHALCGLIVDLRVLHHPQVVLAQQLQFGRGAAHRDAVDVDRGTGRHGCHLQAAVEREAERVLPVGLYLYVILPDKRGTILHHHLVRAHCHLLGKHVGGRHLTVQPNVGSAGCLDPDAYRVDGS